MHVRIGVVLAMFVCGIVGSCVMPATSLAAGPENANFIGHWELTEGEGEPWTITSENFATGDCAGTTIPGFTLTECKVTGSAYVFTIRQEGTSYTSSNKGTIKGNTIVGSFNDGSEHTYKAIRQLNLTGTWSAVYHCEVVCEGAEFPATDTLTQAEGSHAVEGSNEVETISGTVTGDTFKYHSSVGSYETNATLTVAANGLSWTGRLQDSNGTSGTYTAEKLSGGTSPPSVASLSPTSGSTLGGTAVTITGTGFSGGATVSFGSSPASSVTVNSASSITATSPAGSGAVNVTVTTASGTSATSAADLFTYVEPPPTPPLVAHLAEVAPTSPPVPVPVPVPAPQLGLTGNVASVSGTVLVRLRGTTVFLALSSLRQIPFGSTIEATHGRVSVTTAAPHGGTQTGEFFEGEFVLTQGHSGQAVAALAGGSFTACPTARERAHTARASASAASKKHVVRKLWADAHGSFSTKGNYAAGAVAGTEWLTEDLCDGTLIRVTRDKVAVTDLVNHHHLTVTVGHQYLVKAP
jgi:hypothetical protein